MNDYFAFRKMITPVFIQVIFWLIVLLIVIAGITAISNDQAGSGILILIFGPLIARVYAEILIVIFRISADVQAIRQRGDRPS